MKMPLLRAFLDALTDRLPSRADSLSAESVVQALCPIQAAPKAWTDARRVPWVVRLFKWG